MTYEPGTTLSFGDMKGINYQEVTVVTKGNVFIRILDSKPHREFMSLEDWLIINKGEDIKVTTDNLSKKILNLKPRTLIRWFSKGFLQNGKGSRRTAVVLHEGALLQIKLVEGSTVTKDNTFFTSYDEWVSTFPSEGDVMYYKP